jgi:hypothetical protein
MATTIENILKGNTGLASGTLKYTIAGLEARQNSSKASGPIDIPLLSLKDRKIGSGFNTSFKSSSSFTSSAQINLRDFKAAKINKGDVVKSLDEVHSSIVGYLNIINKNTGQIFNFVKEVDNRSQIGLMEIRKDLDVVRATQDSLDKKILKFDYRLKQVENKPAVATVWNKSTDDEDEKKKPSSSSGGGFWTGVATAAGVGAAAAAGMALRAFRGGGMMGPLAAATWLKWQNPYANRTGDEKKITDEQWAEMSDGDKNKAWKQFRKNDAYAKPDKDAGPAWGEDFFKRFDEFKLQLKDRLKSIEDKINEKSPNTEEYGPWPQENPDAAQNDSNYLKKRQNQLLRRKQSILDKQSQVHEEIGDKNNLPSWAQLGLYKTGEWGAWGAVQGTKAAGLFNPLAWTATGVGVFADIAGKKAQFEKDNPQGAEDARNRLKAGRLRDPDLEFKNADTLDELLRKNGATRADILHVEDGQIFLKNGKIIDPKQEQTKKHNQIAGETPQKMSYSPDDNKGLTDFRLRKSDITIESLNDIKLVALQEITLKSRKIILDADSVVIDSPSITYTSEPNRGAAGFIKAALTQEGAAGGINSLGRDAKPSQDAPDDTKPGLPGRNFDNGGNNNSGGGNITTPSSSPSGGNGVATSPSPNDDILGGMSKTLPPLPSSGLRTNNTNKDTSTPRTNNTNRDTSGRSTWFDTNPGGYKGWNDPAGAREGKHASGLPGDTPGIATNDPSKLGQWVMLHSPDGRSSAVRYVDIGPGKRSTSKGVVRDINAAAADQFGYTPKTYTEKGWSHDHIGKELPPGISPGLQSSEPKDESRQTGSAEFKLDEKGAHGYTRDGINTKPWLVDTVRNASKVLPDGYTAKVISSVDDRSRTRWHPRGDAIDIAIYDPKGNKIPNIGNRNVPGYDLYEKVALEARKYQEEKYPNEKFIWGGHFHSGVPFDRMHMQSGGVSAENFSKEQLSSPRQGNVDVSKPTQFVPDQDNNITPKDDIVGDTGAQKFGGRAGDVTIGEMAIGMPSSLYTKEPISKGREKWINQGPFGDVRDRREESGYAGNWMVDEASVGQQGGDEFQERLVDRYRNQNRRPKTPDYNNAPIALDAGWGDMNDAISKDRASVRAQRIEEANRQKQNTDSEMIDYFRKYNNEQTTQQQAPGNMGGEPIGPSQTFSKEDKIIPPTSFSPEKEPGRPGNDGGRGGAEPDPDAVGLE